VLAIESVGPDGGFTGPALVVSQIFAMARAGAGPTAIARRLNGLGLPAPLGGSWMAGTVRGILRNPVYAGRVVYGRRRAVPLAEAAGAVPPLVPPAEWEEVQALAAGLSRRRGADPGYRALLAGLLRCPCGGPLHLTYKAGRRFYRCTRNAQGGACPFAPGQYPAELIEAAVSLELKARYSSRVAAAAARPDREADLLRHACTEVAARCAAVAAEMARLKRAARRGEIGLRTFEELMADAQAEQGALAARRAELEARLQTGGELPPPADPWSPLSLAEQRAVLGALVREVEVYRPRRSRAPLAVQITWKQA
jgi:hypothetical protein